MMGFVQAASILVYTAGLYALGALFDAMPGMQGFQIFSGAMGALGLTFVLLRFLLDRQTSPANGPPAEPKA